MHNQSSAFRKPPSLDDKQPIHEKAGSRQVTSQVGHADWSGHTREQAHFSGVTSPTPVSREFAREWQLNGLPHLVQVTGMAFTRTDRSIKQKQICLGHSYH